jgi:hypothetical protein
MGEEKKKGDMMEQTKLEVMNLDYREIVDLYKVLQHYLQSMPNGEAKDTAKALTEQLESHVRFRIWE